ncbi:hypothetical protein B0H13DRAFT_1919062 [Mycena leptocephala]|nr:hypothetical protein B0H13DRAFT_1919062 [Mycena leptocephala]
MPLAVLCRLRYAMLVVATVLALYPDLPLHLDRFIRHPDPRLPSAPASYTHTPRMALSPQLVATRRRKMYTDYEMVCKRYSDFVAFRDILERESMRNYPRSRARSSPIASPTRSSRHGGRVWSDSCVSLRGIRSLQMGSNALCAFLQDRDRFE